MVYGPSVPILPREVVSSLEGIIAHCTEEIELFRRAEHWPFARRASYQMAEENARYDLDIESFQLADKCGIIAVSDSSAPTCLIKVRARDSHHARRRCLYVASAFPLAYHYRAVLAWGPS
jgi:hypothetical protein